MVQLVKNTLTLDMKCLFEVSGALVLQLLLVILNSNIAPL